jgi:hypothetical protein
VSTTNQKLETFFFWIDLEGKLDELYYSTAKQFADRDIKLLPIGIDQVSRLTALSELGHVTVLCSTRNAAQFTIFNKRVAPVLGMLLRQDRLSFFHFSSFQKLDLGQKNWRQKNYFFLKYPLNLESLCDKLKRFHELREDRAKAWPGGRRAKVPGLAA